MAQPQEASPNSVVAGGLPGHADFGNAFCVRVAGNIDATTAVCEPEASPGEVIYKEVEPGVPGSGLAADDRSLSYADAFAEASSQNRPLCFWAGPSPQEADYVLYLPAGTMPEGVGDIRMVVNEAASDAAVEQMGRSDISAVRFREATALPERSVLYVNVGEMFANDTYIDVYTTQPDGSLGQLESGIRVSSGNVSFGIDSLSDYVLVPSSSEAAGSVETREWHSGIQQGSEDGFPVAIVAAIVGLLLAIAVAFVLLGRRARRARVRGRASAQTPVRHETRSGKRGGLS